MVLGLVVALTLWLVSTSTVTAQPQIEPRLVSPPAHHPTAEAKLASRQAATGMEITDGLLLSKRLVDTPIVRSSKGCLAYLGENAAGEVIVIGIEDMQHRPACNSGFSYGATDVSASSQQTKK